MKEREIVKIVNMKQAIGYMKNNVNPLKTYYNNGVVVFEFVKEETQPLYYKWLKKELI